MALRLRSMTSRSYRAKLSGSVVRLCRSSSKSFGSDDIFVVKVILALAGNSLMSKELDKKDLTW